MNSTIAVVIVGYNSQPYLEDCLGSLRSATYRNLQVVFVDNASSDDSIAYVKKHFPAVKVIQNRQNWGFARGNNIGIKKALALGAEYILLLNPDTIMDKQCLVRLYEQADRQTILQPLILLHNGAKTQQVNTAGNVLNYLGFSYCGSYRRKAADYRQVQEITLVSGAGMWLPAAVLKDIGLLDEHFFMYHEDVDLSWRARLAGYRLKLVPSARIWHKYVFSRNPKKFYYVERNRLFFILKNYQARTLWLIAPMLLISELAMLTFALAGGWLGLKIKSYGEVLANFGRLRREQGLSKRSKQDGDVKGYFTWELDFGEVQSALLPWFNKLLSIYWRAVRRLV